MTPKSATTARLGACLLLIVSTLPVASQESTSEPIRTNSEGASETDAGENGVVGLMPLGENEILLLGQESEIDFTQDDDPLMGAPEASVSEVIDVQVVNVEVVVTNKSGQPIPGLTRDDFTLYEDGRLIELSNFFIFPDSSLPLADALAVNSSGGATTGATSAAALATTASLPNSVTQDRHIIVFVDNLNIRPQSRKLLFASLRDHLREHSGQRMMLVTMNRRIKIEQSFTRDVDQILAALDKIETQESLHALYDGARRIYLSRLERASLRIFTPRQGLETDADFDDAIRVALELSESARLLAEERYQKVEATLEALGSLCDNLGGINGRKALIYLSDGLPIRPADPLIEAWNSKYQNWVIANTEAMRNNSRFPGAAGKFTQLTTAIDSSQFDLQSELNRLTIQATDNRVAFYPISTSGRTNDSISAEYTGSATNDSGSMRRDAQELENFTRDTALMRMAGDTGGRAVLRNANLGKLLEDVESDLTHFYSLGYSPQSRGPDFRPRKLHVEVKVPGARARHFKAHRTKSWRQRLGEKTAAAALFAVEENPLQVRVAPGDFTTDGESYTVPLMVKVPFHQIRLVHQDQHFNAQLTVLVQVRGDQDGLSRPRRFDLPIKIPDHRVLEVLPQVAAYPLELLMLGGPHRVAIGIHDHLAHTDATLMVDLVIEAGEPDRSRQVEPKAAGQS